MGPKVRRALHEALDLVLDAMSEEALETPQKRARTRPSPPAPMPANVSAEVVEDVAQRLRRRGFSPRKAS